MVKRLTKKQSGGWSLFGKKKPVLPSFKYTKGKQSRHSKSTSGQSRHSKSTSGHSRHSKSTNGNTIVESLSKEELKKIDREEKRVAREKKFNENERQIAMLDEDRYQKEINKIRLAYKDRNPIVLSNAMYKFNMWKFNQQIKAEQQAVIRAEKEKEEIKKILENYRKEDEKDKQDKEDKERRDKKKDLHDFENTLQKVKNIQKTKRNEAESKYIRKLKEKSRLEKNMMSNKEKKERNNKHAEQQETDQLIQQVLTPQEKNSRTKRFKNTLKYTGHRIANAARKTIKIYGNTYAKAKEDTKRRFAANKVKINEFVDKIKEMIQKFMMKSEVGQDQASSKLLSEKLTNVVDVVDIEISEAQGKENQTKKSPTRSSHSYSKAFINAM